MRKEQIRRRGTDPVGSHRLFLLLFFLCGAFLLRFWPPMRELLGGTEKLLPCVLLLPALLGGSPCGLLLIPTGAILLGAAAMLKMSETGTFPDALYSLWPILLLTPLFFLAGTCGMRMSEDCLTALTRGDQARRRTLLIKELVLWGAAIAAAAWTNYFI